MRPSNLYNLNDMTNTCAKYYYYKQIDRMTSKFLKEIIY